MKSLLSWKELCKSVDDSERAELAVQLGQRYDADSVRASVRLGLFVVY